MDRVLPTQSLQRPSGTNQFTLKMEAVHVYWKYTRVNQKVKVIFKLRGNWERCWRIAQYWQCQLKSSAICSTALWLQSSGSNEGENMDTPLQDNTIEEQSGVVRFLWAEGVKPVEIHRRTLAQYGQSTMSERKVYEWVERFKSVRTRATDEGHSGLPSTSRAAVKHSSAREYRN